MYQRLRTAGTKVTQDEREKRRIMLVNSVCLFTLIPPALYFFVFQFAHEPFLQWMTIPFGLSFLIPIVLNHFNRTIAAKYACVFLLSLAIVIYSSLLGKASGIGLVTFAVAAIAVVVFDPQQRIKLSLSFLIPAATFVFLEVTHYRILPRVVMADAFLEVSYILSICVTFGLIFVVLAFFTSQLNKAYEILKTQRQKLDMAERHQAYALLTRHIAHELKNPLVSMHAQAEEFIYAAQPSLDTAKTMAELIIKQAERLSKLISSMLKYSAKKLSTEMVSLNLNTIIADLLVLFEVQASRKMVGLQAKFDPEMPMMTGSDDFIPQVITNLVANALEYTPAGGLIRIETRQGTLPGKTTPSAIIEVSDSGVGIPATDLPKIFEPYFTSKAQTENAGLGLPLVKRIVEEHRGIIQVNSEVGKGTSFTIFLPVG
ncbi:MAG: nitrogen regulation protein NR(II) [Candidatus Margulisiibacteriota bacterium]